MEVPTNVEVRLTYGSTSPAGADPVLETSDGMSVDLTVEAGTIQGSVPPDLDRVVVILRPEVLLAPNTTYRILDRVSNEGPCDGGSCPHSLVASFITGPSADDVPPTFGGITDGRIACQSCYSDACCGPYELRVATIDWADAADDGTAEGIAYDVYAGGSRIATRIRTSSFSSLATTMRVVAYDAAGNPSPATAPFEVAGTCTFLGDPDAGTIFDAGTVTDAGARDSSVDDATVSARDGGGGGGGGCTVAAPADVVPSLPIAFLPFALWLAVRLRRDG